MIRNYDLQKAASAFRVKNGIGGSEPVILKSLLQKLNVITVFLDLSDGFCGMALKQGDARFILVNSRHSLGKQHFTIGHELYHLFVQHNFTSMVCTTGAFNKKNKVEYEADWFASFLLIPDEGVLAFIPKEEMGKNKITIGTIVKIEQYFACSRIALLHRLNDMGLIDFESYINYTVSVKNSALAFGFDKSLYEGGNHGLVIGEYGEKAQNLFRKEVISESHYFSLMNDIGIDLDKERTANNEQAVI
jgi:Zn-dependent peptidase ImmA (M78 family)